MRLLRIAAIAVALPLALPPLQRVADGRRQEPVEGLEWALGALSILFFLRALATEYSRGPEANLPEGPAVGPGGRAAR